MNKHLDIDLGSLECPFPLKLNSFSQSDWNEIKSIISTDDKERTIIVEKKDGKKFLLSIPKLLYDAIYKSCEDKYIENDIGFNDLV